MNLNAKQWMMIAIAILSVLAVSTANLNDIFGPHMAKIIVSTANMLNAMLAGIATVLTGQTAMVKDVAAMPGVESIKVNSQANQTLAQIAMDPAADKVEATPQAAAAVAATAQQ